ncbi:uncharacterized protein LOC135812433 isoform X2 [Sycon ciliatum]|uniref:uncharacterized protein LOC135812432 isoform X2 n=1 Tax=Sycon ciliatum TaxID=27933 RepID=UPI0031F6C9F2
MPYANNLDVTDVDFPASLVDVYKVEKANDLSINVFGYEDDLYPLKLTGADDAINLLVIHDDGVNHFAWIKNFGALCAHQRKKKARVHFCMRCLPSHNSVETLERHQRYCKDVKFAAVEMPEPGEKLMFKDIVKVMKMPYVIYAGTECLVKPCSAQHGHEPFEMLSMFRVACHTSQ